MENATKETKRVFEYVGATYEQHIEINQLRDEIIKVKDVYAQNIAQFKYMIELLDVQKFFLDNSAKRLKSGSKKYNDFRTSQLKSTESEFAKYTGLLKAEEQFQKLAENLLNLYDKKVGVESKGLNENGDEVIVLTYDSQFYEILVLFAKTFGILK